MENKQLFLGALENLKGLDDASKLSSIATLAKNFGIDQTEAVKIADEFFKGVQAKLELVTNNPVVSDEVAKLSTDKKLAAVTEQANSSVKASEVPAQQLEVGGVFNTVTTTTQAELMEKFTKEKQNLFALATGMAQDVAAVMLTSYAAANKLDNNVFWNEYLAYKGNNLVNDIQVTATPVWDKRAPYFNTKGKTISLARLKEYMAANRYSGDTLPMTPGMENIYGFNKEKRVGQLIFSEENEKFANYYLVEAYTRLINALYNVEVVDLEEIIKFVQGCEIKFTTTIGQVVNPSQCFIGVRITNRAYEIVDCDLFDIRMADCFYISEIRNNTFVINKVNFDIKFKDFFDRNVKNNMKLTSHNEKYFKATALKFEA